MRVSEELAQVLREAEEEVAKWEPWQRSLDPIGEAGKAKYELRGGEE